MRCFECDCVVFGMFLLQLELLSWRVVSGKYDSENETEMSRRMLPMALGSFGLFLHTRRRRTRSKSVSVKMREFPATSIPWSVFFASLVWQIWKRRNSIIFTDTDTPNEVLFRYRKSWSQHFLSTAPATSRSSMLRVPEAVQWQPGPIEYCTINTDGVVHLQTSMGLAGGFVRNHASDWIIGFNKYVGLCHCFPC
ncbi:hypothetical protein V6N12_067340 [Hibiscus sabdariffa]|uniref:RNase H type-1 domain-containing protein n=1 Tax=Hibiscus sabdariffa TaxID=183260 RepID=A0ABR2BE14_9ROSI